MVFTRRVTLFQKCRWRQWPCLEGLFDFHLGPPVSFKALFLSAFQSHVSSLGSTPGLALYCHKCKGASPLLLSSTTVTSVSRKGKVLPLDGPNLCFLTTSTSRLKWEGRRLA